MTEIVQGALLSTQGARVTSLADRAKMVAQFLATGDKSVFGGWFGPSAPMTPSAPPDTQGRQMDYPVGYNTSSTTPRSEEQVSFQTLRQLADSYDILRLVIETRKDQLERMKWEIRPKEGGTGSAKRAVELTRFFESPDKQHTWSGWSRALWEDLFVLDAPTIYNRQTALGKGDPFALELIDGATIMPLLDSSGRVPSEPGTPAYQQVLKGVRAVNYTKDELLYLPRNPRTHKVYGYGPVEQVIMTVNIALRRQVHQLSYYTEGNAPDLIMGVPKEWNATQIEQFQRWWNGLIDSGNQQDRRKTRFVPDGIKVVDTKERALTDKTDEWLARVICFCFSISPQAFVAQMNKATAETAQETALEEGLSPVLKWTINFMNTILVRFFHEDQYEFVWLDEKAMDPEVQARIHQIQVTTGIRPVDEIRIDDLGLDALKPVEGVDGGLGTGAPETPAQNAALNGAQIASLLSVCQDVATGVLSKPSAEALIAACFPALDPKAIKGIVEPIEVSEPEPAPAPLPPPGQSPKPEGAAASTAAPLPEPPQGAGNTSTKIAKAAKKPTAPMTRPAFTKAEKLYRGAIKKWLRAQINPIASQITTQIGKLAKGSDQEDINAEVEEIIKSLGFKNPGVIRRATEQFKEAMYNDAGYETLQAIAAETVQREALTVVNDEAAKWAEEKAGAMVTGLEDATRDMLRSTVSAAISEGWSTAEVADALADEYAFSDARAETIARTELADANVQGTLTAYRESGVVDKKEWLVSQDEVCDECEAAAQLGPVALDDDFGGAGDPPAHPNCRCDILPVLSEDGDTTEGESK